MQYFYGSFTWSGHPVESETIGTPPDGAPAGRLNASKINGLPAGKTVCVGGFSLDHVQESGVHAMVITPMPGRGMLPPRNGTPATRLVDGYLRTGALDLESIATLAAVILIDETGRRILVATDRFGVIPIYFHRHESFLFVGTRLSDLTGNPAIQTNLSDQALYNYLFFHCIPSPRTAYTEIEKLPPAEYLDWSGQEIRRREYWKPTFASSRPAGSIGESSRSLMKCMESAVASSAIIPGTGAFLSGGLDSSTVVGMLKRVDDSAAAYTIGFDQPGYDETAFARVTARHFDVKHREYYLTPLDVLKAWPSIAAFYDEPFGNSSAIPAYYCAKLARDHGERYLLAGDGGDELFGGNVRYIRQRAFERYFSAPKFARHGLEALYRHLPFLTRIPIVRKPHRYSSMANMRLPDRLQAFNFLHRLGPSEILDPDWLDNIDPNCPWQEWRDRFFSIDAPSNLQRMLYLDWKFTLADNDLVKVTQMSEMAGIAVRYPMLDYRVVDHSTTLPEAWLLNAGNLRGYYKIACQGFLPDQILNKPKHGFGLPFGMWMQKEARLRELVLDCLSQLDSRAIFSSTFLNKCIRMYEGDAPSYYGELLWVLVTFELWMQSRR